MNFDNYKFHCSSLGALCTDPRSGSGLSETTKGELLDIWIKERWGRTKTDTNKYIEKGLSAEEDGITLYSLVTNTFYAKNIYTFENEFIIGTPDIIQDSIVRDIKCSWNMHTFYGNFKKPMNKSYKFQINGYWDLVPDCTGGKLVYVLINTPDTLIEQEKSKLRYKMGLIDAEANGVYVMAAEEIERNSLFDDMPDDKRWVEFDVPKIDMQTEVYDRVPSWREFLNDLSK